MNNTAEYINLIENAITAALPQCDTMLNDVPKMLKYSLEGGGKRIRPLLCLEFASCAGGDVKTALPLAVAVEFVHTYSLIHDDLPCMDNDDYRRGKLSSHKKFGEANALLAGDALLTHAFNIIADAAKNGTVSALTAARAVAELSSLAGANGMIGGQYIDLSLENKTATADELFTMDRLKTSCLIEAACVLGLLAANAEDEKIESARQFSKALGLAFQITDDVLEAESEETGSDIINNKATYVSIFGIEKAKELSKKYTEQAVNSLNCFGASANEIKEIALSLLNRKN